jgi:hypothetical protein
MSYFVGGKRPMRVAAATVLMGAAVLMTRAAVAHDCPRSPSAVCFERWGGTVVTYGAATHCRTGNGTSIGTVTCGITRNVIVPVSPPTTTTYSSAMVTATSTVQIQGRMLCNGAAKTWSIIPSADPNHPPVSHSADCFGAPITNVTCQGLAVQVPCQ